MSVLKKQIDEIVPLVLVQNDEYWLPYVLASIEGHFGRIVIYNVGSTDDTERIIEEFKDRNIRDTDVLVKHLPACDPKIQGCFRNSMIAEARSDIYWILDGDEISDSKSIQNIKDAYVTMKREYELNGKLYGVLRRIEVCDDLDSAYGISRFLSHHRLYHRLAIWTGTHPGERPVYRQDVSTEVMFGDTYVYHFHNCRRSRHTALGRERRKRQETYRRGGLSEFDAYNTLPILHKQLGFPAHPILRKKQSEGNSIPL